MTKFVSVRDQDEFARAWKRVLGCLEYEPSENAPTVDVLNAVADRFLEVEAQHQGECDRFRRWINDLQSGMYVNCVYCGHRYGPADETPVSMADALKAHVEECPERP